MKEKQYGWVAAFVLLTLAGVLFSSHLDAPFDRSHQGWGGAFYGIAARNYLEQGPAASGFALCDTPGSNPAPKSLYVNHPPMVGLLVAASFKVLGEGEAPARGIMILLSLGATGLFYLFLSRLFGGSVLLASMGALCAAAMPVWAYFGSMVDPQGAGVMFSVAGASWAAGRWCENGRARELATIVVFLIFGFLFDWPAFYFAGLLGLWAVLAFRKKGILPAVLIWGSALAFGLAYFGWVRWLGDAHPVSDIFAGFERRIGADPGVAAQDPLTFRVMLEGIYGYHLALFPHGLSLPGLAGGALLLVLCCVRKASAASGLLLVILGFAVIHVGLFVEGAYRHLFWQIYLAPGLAFLPFWFLSWLARNGPAARTCALLMVLVIVCVTVTLGWEFSRSRWARREATLHQLQEVGSLLRGHCSRESVVLSSRSIAIEPMIEYYSDRQVISHVRDLETAVKGYFFFKGQLGGLLIHESEREIFEKSVEGLKWKGPLRSGDFLFWAAQ